MDHKQASSGWGKVGKNDVKFPIHEPFNPRNLIFHRNIKDNVLITYMKILQGVHGQGKSQGKKYFFKVRELSGNFEISQGILEFKLKSGKSQGILK